jgi:nicotinamidase-related amidase
VSQRAVALIVVDMQTGLDDPQYGERCNPRCEANIQRLLSAWRNAAQPVLYTQHISQRPSSPLAEGSAGNAIKQELAPLESETVFRKSTNSALKSTELLQALQGIDPSAVVIVGVATDACVTATAREARDLGYITVVVSDACATFSRPGPEGTVYSATMVQGVSLAALAASGIRVCSATQAIDDWCRYPGLNDA